MHHNFLSNYCLFYTLIDTRECFKVLSILDTMRTNRLPLKSMEYCLFEGRREIKQLNRPKQKNLRTEFQLIVIKDEDVLFMHNREKGLASEGKAGHMTISSKSFFQILQRNRLIGEVALLKTIKIAIQSFLWQNYIITHYEVTPQKSLLIIQQVYSSTLMNLNNEQAELIKKTKLLFQPLLELMFSTERAAIELAKFQKQLRGLRMLYSELDREMDKQKKINESNYCLIYYYAIMQAIKQSEQNG